MRIVKSILFVALAGCGIFGGGAPKQTMLTSSGNVAGEGTVQAKAGDNNNTVVSVKVRHLAHPQRLAADAAVYVVWIEPANGRAQNVGALQVDSDLVGTLDTVTPHKSFKLIITPEPNASGQSPTHQPVFSADVNRAD